MTRISCRAPGSSLPWRWPSVPGSGRWPIGTSITGMDVLRHGGMPRLFSGARAPSTLGTFLRAFRFGHVRQLDAVAARVLAGLACNAPIISAGESVTYLDVDDTVRATFGYAKQGAGFGYCGVKGLNALLATVSSASSAPVIVATRLRKGSANSARGAARLVADAIKTTRSCGAGGLLVLRADSAYYGALLRRRRDRRRPTPPHPLLHHRPQRPGRDSGDCRDSRRCVDHDPLPSGKAEQIGRPLTP